MSIVVKRGSTSDFFYPSGISPPIGDACATTSPERRRGGRKGGRRGRGKYVQWKRPKLTAKFMLMSGTVVIDAVLRNVLYKGKGLDGSMGLHHRSDRASESRGLFHRWHDLAAGTGLRARRQSTRWPCHTNTVSHTQTGAQLAHWPWKNSALTTIHTLRKNNNNNNNNNNLAQWPWINAQHCGITIIHFI